MTNLINKFDDVTTSEGTWSQVCKSCVDHLEIQESMLDDAGSGICGVEGCDQESNYYIDFA